MKLVLLTSAHQKGELCYYLHLCICFVLIKSHGNQHPDINKQVVGNKVECHVGWLGVDKTV